MTDPVDLQAMVRGINEALILATVRDEPRHGYQIAVQVERASDGTFGFQHGTLYPILHRLEKEDRIAGRWDTADGRRRKVYRITSAGEEWLEAQAGHIRSTFEALVRALEASR
jgi:DNA-binding PadR family transcriptional regulator